MSDPVNAVMSTEIGRFISNRWAEAKQDLEQLDSAYVNTIAALPKLEEHGVILPAGFPLPSQRLPSTWYALLEATFETLRQMDRVNLTVEKMSSATNYREAVYYQDTLGEATYNLCEKVNRLIEYSCGFYSLGRLKDKYRDQVNVIRDRIGKVRHGLVHSYRDEETGGRPSEGLTQDQLWEPFVALGDEMLAWLLDDPTRPTPDFGGRAPAAIGSLVVNLGAILNPLSQTIERIRARKQ